jgi:hypothetical protein
MFKSPIAAVLAAMYLVLMCLMLAALAVSSGETIGGMVVLLTLPSYLLSDWLGIYAQSRFWGLAILAACATLNASIIYCVSILLERALTEAFRRRRRPHNDERRGKS